MVENHSTGAADHYDLSRISVHGIIASVAAACALGLVITWSAGAIAPRIQPILLFTTLFTFATALLGATLALLRRRQRPVFTKLAVILTACVVFIAIATFGQSPANPLWRAINQILQ
ncbi:MAG: hypothetical protein H0U59_04030 [Gemmatimonadaceae bacterium]|nr:hypothetical protein [Gemmatimonadaceae bacterium]MBA3753408.1 hypothetical protein [Nitrospira sp.]